MIASLQGVIEALGGDFLIMNVAGVGFKIIVPTSVLREGGMIGKNIKLFTHLHVREDDLSLYGFASTDGLRFFELLRTVSGLGPKTAMALLSALSTDELTLAIATGSVETLTSVPGIGKKTADRMVLELKEKVGSIMISTTIGRSAQENADVILALVSLGYSVAEASRAVASLPVEQKITLEEKIKMSLQNLAG